MNTYKITNITNLLGKRDFNYNTTLNIDILDGMLRKNIEVKPSMSVYVTLNKLPLNIHRLRIKGWVSVSIVGENELNEVKKKKDKTKKTVSSENIEENDGLKKKSSIKKKTHKQKQEDIDTISESTEE